MDANTGSILRVIAGISRGRMNKKVVNDRIRSRRQGLTRIEPVVLLIVIPKPVQVGGSPPRQECFRTMVEIRW